MATSLIFAGIAALFVYTQRRRKPFGDDQDYDNDDDVGIHNGLNGSNRDGLPTGIGRGAFTKAERVTMDVGFYYMANAGGRLLGTVLSGLTYQLGGLPLMLGAATAMVALAALAAGRLRHDLVDQTV